MGRVVVWFIVLVGICYTSAEEDVIENGIIELPTESPTESTIESTSDTPSDLNPGATTAFTTTTASTTSDESSGEEDGIQSGNGCDDRLTEDDKQKFSNAMESFSKDLFQKIFRQSKSHNVVVSPFSVVLSLLQLTLGAQEQTQRALLETLHLESFPCLHEKMHKITKKLVERALSIATRIYVQKDFPIIKEFLEKSEKLYGSKALNLGPDAKKNLEDINHWVKDATKGKIKNFLSELPKDLELILLNAIHFKGVWKYQFDPSNTIKDPFYVDDETYVMVDMMSATKYPLSYVISQKLESMVARLPFKEDMSFYILVPYSSDWNISKILKNLNQSELNSQLTREKPTTVKVPKLHLDFKLDLKDVLSSLGLAELFKEPNLKGISNDTLAVSAVEHQSVMDLNEEGVEAAGVTAVVVTRSLLSFSVNRPFIFLLYDNNFNLPLFQGYVRLPDHEGGKGQRSEIKKALKIFDPK